MDEAMDGLSPKQQAMLKNKDEKYMTGAKNGLTIT